MYYCMPPTMHVSSIVYIFLINSTLSILFSFARFVISEYILEISMADKRKGH